MRRIFGRAGLGYAAATTALLALGFGTVIAVLEPEIGNPFDGIWWAVVTLTTVGYGDISPSSTAGRLLAIALMLVGIGFVAVLTAAVAAHMVDDDASDDELVVEMRLIRERLDALEAGLSGSSPTDET